MSLAQKLRGQKTETLAAAPKRALNACQKSGCDGIYIPARVGLLRADGRVWDVVCFKPTCYRCGHVRQYITQDGTRRDDYYHWNGEKVFRDFANFWVPREMCETPVYDKQGAPVFGADGKQVFQYSQNMKIEFVQKLLALADKKRAHDQYFKLEEVMAVKIN